MTSVLGAYKSAQRLAQRLNRDVHSDDIRVLAERGQLAVADMYLPPDSTEPHAVFAVVDIDRLTVDQVDAVIAARSQGTLDTVNFNEACDLLGWTWEFHVAVHLHKIQPNIVGRYARADVAALTVDTELAEQLRQVREQIPRS
ncbi:hypothetical protein [Nocardia terpenica]|uniref:Uncharacterized protein n=1 Tax=Nocardia terpenica TaxID=455432 RepID=A0A164MFK9_9NOCA|nr:hypothetical protein [Nocardia terpenica]KZM73312.1 hypothetical protein AWN90_32135 [Nocardia terpenica]NQE87538.1 hypothetical protein [Nocardia terpenica]